ncbi:MAG: carboxymuconolactone decarboxylase family protein [Microthrixaceae bacterium]|nr:carboxymuconolactone decarboxylase family protein [Microthrixaceae bacterium]
MVRLPPPDRSTLDAEVDDLLSLATAPSGDTAETIAVMAHCPALVRPFLEWSMALHTEGVLPPRLHEIIALRVAHNCGSGYEWDEHVGWATRAGLTDSEIAAVAGDPQQWPPTEATVIAAVDELHVERDLTVPTLQALRDRMDDPWVVELILVVGQYTMLSMLSSATGSAAHRSRRARN